MLGFGVMFAQMVNNSLIPLDIRENESVTQEPCKEKGAGYRSIKKDVVNLGIH